MEFTQKLLNLCLDEEKPLKLTIGSFYISKGYPENHLGEDFHFISQNRQAFGVADGISGWVKTGINAGAYARLLMQKSLTAVGRKRPGCVNPKRVLREAHAKTNVPGTSTACIVALSNRRTLTAANIGDSGFVIFRDRRLVYQSPIQHHGCNTPYQLGTKKYSKDDASIAQEIEVPISAGDIIVAGTNGMRDNMYPEEIESKISEWLKSVSACPGKLAWRLGIQAWCNSLNRDYYSPFRIAARWWGYRYTRGGRLDDITVVVGVVEDKMWSKLVCEVSKRAT